MMEKRKYRRIAACESSSWIGEGAPGTGGEVARRLKHGVVPLKVGQDGPGRLLGLGREKLLNGSGVLKLGTFDVIVLSRGEGKPTPSEVHVSSSSVESVVGDALPRPPGFGL